MLRSLEVKKCVNVGIIGFGTVGSGTADILIKNQDIITRRLGATVVLKRIADIDLERKRDVSVPEEILTKRVEDILDDPEIDIVVELIGGLKEAKEYILTAMKRGKHVVTANKALLAECGDEIYECAVKNNVNIGFEASVCGGIPVIKALKEGLCANRISSITGILNGTSNFILTRMANTGMSYEEAVNEAIMLGYAEDPPDLDVNGTDAAHKIAIMVSIVMGRPFPFKMVYREGIEKLSPDDLLFGDEFGYSVKLLALAEFSGNKVQARVHPAMVPKDHILANVVDVYNAVFIEGDFVGPNLFYGLGAGRNPTGSAVVSDIISLARELNQGVNTITPPLGYQEEGEDRFDIEQMDMLKTPYYFRFSAIDKPGVLSKISGVLGNNNISIHSVIQKGREINGPVPIVMLTHEALESNVRKALSVIDTLDVLTDKTVMIRVYGG